MKELPDWMARASRGIERVSLDDPPAVQVLYLPTFHSPLLMHISGDGTASILGVWGLDPTGPYEYCAVIEISALDLVDSILAVDVHEPRTINLDGCPIWAEVLGPAQMWRHHGQPYGATRLAKAALELHKLLERALTLVPHRAAQADWESLWNCLRNDAPIQVSGSSTTYQIRIFGGLSSGHQPELLSTLEAVPETSSCRVEILGSVAGMLLPDLKRFAARSPETTWVVSTIPHILSKPLDLSRPESRGPSPLS